MYRKIVFALFSLLLNFWFWLGNRLWKYVDVYAPDEETGETIAVTFSKSEKYIDRVGLIKMEGEDYD